MELKSETLHNLIDLEIDHINFLLDLIYSNKTLSLSLINTFISTAELQSSSADLEFFNKMILELQVALADNLELQKDLMEIKGMFEKITSRLDKNTLTSALDAFKEKQTEIHDIELKLHSYTPRLLNKVNQNIMSLKSKELRDEISKVIPSSATAGETGFSDDSSDSSNNTIDTNDIIETDSSSEVSEEDVSESTECSENNEDNESIENTETTESEEITDVATEETKEEPEAADDSQIQEPENIENTENIVNNAIQEIVNEANETNNDNTTEEKNENTENIETTDETNIQNVNVNNEEVPSKDSLIISEITGEVTLPFTHTVVNIDEFKNPVSSRFREGYKLSRERENESVLISISVGLKLCFKSKIHPAIIRACRDFDDLDTYLFYLDNNQADYFPNFKILYKSYPMKNYIKN